MKLAGAARYFDRLPVYDAYTNRELFKGQFDLFDDSKRDAINVMRRTLSVPPMTVVPPRHAVRAASQHWIIGRNANNDTFMSGLIRTKYTVQLAAGLATVRTPGEVIGNSGGTQMYAGLGWMKDWKEIEHSSRVYPYYEVYVAAAEPLAPDAYIELEGKVLRARGTYVSEAGFLVAESDDLQGARVSISYRARSVYNPATDTVTTTPVTTPALNVHYTANYRREQPSAPKREPGDLIILVRKVDVAAAKAGDQLVLGTRAYNVISVEDESDCWNLTVRPA